MKQLIFIALLFCVANTCIAQHSFRAIIKDHQQNPLAGVSVTPVDGFVINGGIKLRL